MRSSRRSDLGHLRHQCRVELIVCDVIAKQQVADAFVTFLTPVQSSRGERGGDW